jgi:hypothetical protein
MKIFGSLQGNELRGAPRDSNTNTLQTFPRGSFRIIQVLDIGPVTTSAHFFGLLLSKDKQIEMQKQTTNLKRFSSK